LTTVYLTERGRKAADMGLRVTAGIAAAMAQVGARRARRPGMIGRRISRIRRGPFDA